MWILIAFFVSFGEPVKTPYNSEAECLKAGADSGAKYYQCKVEIQNDSETN